MTNLDNLIFRSIQFTLRHTFIAEHLEDKEEMENFVKTHGDKVMAAKREHRIKIMNIFLNGPRFINKNGQPLQMMKKLELDPELLEQPLYH